MADTPTAAEGFPALPERVPNQYKPGTNPYKIYEETVASSGGFPAPKIVDVNSTAGSPGFEGAPEHYKTEAGIQSFDVIDAYGLDFYLGNAWKYFSRWKRKGSAKNDLEKCAHYLQEALNRAPRITGEFYNLDDIDLTPAVVLPAFGFESDSLMYDAALDLLLSRTTAHPRTYLRSSLAQLQEFMKTM